MAVWAFSGLLNADPNPLDFYFWVAAEKTVYNVNPKNINDLKRKSWRLARSVIRETQYSVADNFHKGPKCCLEEKVGYF